MSIDRWKAVFFFPVIHAGVGRLRNGFVVKLGYVPKNIPRIRSFCPVLYRPC
jgi:hypothetical protein